MSLVLVSRLSLDELESLVNENFSSIENKNLPFKDFSKYGPVFSLEHSFGKIFNIIPLKKL